jgi:hypothetical protein
VIIDVFLYRFLLADPDGLPRGDALGDESVGMGVLEFPVALARMAAAGFFGFRSGRKDRSGHRED